MNRITTKSPNLEIIYQSNSLLFVCSISFPFFFFYYILFIIFFGLYPQFDSLVASRHTPAILPLFLIFTSPTYSGFFSLSVGGSIAPYTDRQEEIKKFREETAN